MNVKRQRGRKVKMSGPSNRSHASGIAIALAIALVALAGSAWAGSTGSATSTALKPNVKYVVKSFSISNGGFDTQYAGCPAGTRIFSGGYVSTGQFAQVVAAAPAAKANAYLVTASMPPVNINVPVLKETAKISLVAYCAPAGQPIVLGTG